MRSSNPSRDCVRNGPLLRKRPGSTPTSPTAPRKYGGSVRGIAALRRRGPNAMSLASVMGPLGRQCDGTGFGVSGVGGVMLAAGRVWRQVLVMISVVCGRTLLR